ncbi:MAG: hypothetical protein MR967_07715 [Holdemanella sp.]|uniref:hypothetical protein n=1 Tax=Holdemanella sp. TaxID=1971762 RepID=UPI00258C2A7B|nr:hypothetical protein [Holdemanella sp.]MCI7166806.1 hypothetical protein [Holdemanella sp.]
MSRRTAESNKAMLAAWNKEQELVQEGKGTREWTPKQQQDILEKGKAYDDDGVAFQGQHMKSAEMYPEYQGDPGNIQFLTRAEHLEAHNGNWRNPTNWYFNPLTKEKIDFGDGPFIPCEEINLPEPVVIVPKDDSSFKEQKSEEKIQSDKYEDVLNQNKEVDKITDKKQNTVVPPKIQTPKKSNMFVRGLKSVGRFIVEHPVESLEIAGVVIGGAAKAISSFRGSSSSSSAHSTMPQNDSNSTGTGIVEKVADIVEKANGSMPSENDVSGHRQRYHTKDGVIWKDKAPYHRGGNKD